MTAEEFSRSDKKRRLEPGDRSVTVHVCHSPQREVEILHDRLLAMLEADPELTPRDIVVMVADIDSYSPYIQSVFGSASGERYVPYAISDRRARRAPGVAGVYQPAVVAGQPFRVRRCAGVAGCAGTGCAFQYQRRGAALFAPVGKRVGHSLGDG